MLTYFQLQSPVLNTGEILVHKIPVNEHEKIPNKTLQTA